MNNLYLEAFFAVAEAESISKASEELFISQSALTQRIMNLESEVGVELFKRRKGIKKTELTDAGKRFMPIAEQWRKLEQETLLIKDVEKTKEIRIAAVDSINSFVLKKVYPEFMLSHKDIKLTIRTYYSSDAYHHVECGNIDIAFIATPLFSKSVITLPIGKEEFYMICHRDSKYPSVVRPEDLDQSLEVFLEWSDEFIAWHKYWFGEAIRPKILIDNMMIVDEFLSDKGEWVMAPKSMAETFKSNSAYKVCSMVSGPPERHLYLLKGKNAFSDEAIDEFVSMVKRIY